MMDNRCSGEIRMINFLKSVCSGCGACLSVCPNSAIELRKNAEGFLQPYIVPERCQLCNACENICPMSHQNLIPKSDISSVYVFAAEDSLRWESRGGGFLLQLGQYVLSKGGLICGPAFSADFYAAEYRLVDKIQDLPVVCNFPPLQVNPVGIYSQLQKELQNLNRTVLFIGTPCHVMGLKAFLKREYSNLLTASCACEGVSSSYAWEYFLESQQKDGKVRNVKFDSKALGWRKSLQFVFEDGNSREETQWWIPAMEAGLQLCRGCYACPYSLEKTVADFTVGVFYEIDQYQKQWNDGKGASFVISHTEKGEKYIRKIENAAVLCKKTDRGSFESFFDASKENLSETEKNMSAINSFPVAEKIAQRIRGFFSNKSDESLKDFLQIVQDRKIKLNKLSQKIPHRDRFWNEMEQKGFIRAVSCCLSRELPAQEQQIILDYHAGDNNAGWKILNPKVWNSLVVDARQIFFNNDTKWQWVCLPFNHILLPHQKYQFDIKCKLRTEATSVNFYVTDKEKQGYPALIWSGKPENDSWTRISGIFIPSHKELKYFMFTSTQFTGKNNYLCFEWIRIKEAE